MTAKTALLQSQGQFFHAYNRGVNRENIFFSESDYPLFLRMVEVALDGIGLIVCSYCLMPNHFHFELLQLEAYAMSRFFKRLCDGYVKTVNGLYGRVGHLLQGDYTPKLVERPETLPWLSRYIDRNPVEAGLVKDPLDWEYSSARESCGLREPTFADPSLMLKIAGGESNYQSILLGTNDGADGGLGSCLFME
jgi:putative transposase